MKYAKMISTLYKIGLDLSMYYSLLILYVCPAIAAHGSLSNASNISVSAQALASWSCLVPFFQHFISHALTKPDQITSTVRCPLHLKII